jgi:hypothetical protein
MLLTFSTPRQSPLMAENDENEHHECVGVSCPWVVDTGEAYVCTKTGVCVGDLFVVCFDYTSSSTRFNVSSTIPSTSISKTAIAPTVPIADSEDARGAREQMYAECYRVVTKMLQCGRDDPGGTRSTKLVDMAMKQANGVVKKRRDGKLMLMPVIFDFVRLMQEGAKTGTTEGTQTNWKSAVARRCADCCAMCIRLHPNAPSAKVKISYMCLAVLYMLREGMTVKGVKLCAIDKSVADNLPSLNSLSCFGYAKSKYTKAERFLRTALHHALFTLPLHEIRL